MRPEAEERKSQKYEELRRAAEQLLDGKLDIGTDISAPRIRELVHELSVHQIELELQNEELRRAQHALELSNLKYVDLYDFAPVGYVTLNGQAVVEEANLAAAELLAVPRRELLNAPFLLHVDPEFRSSFYQYFRNVLSSETSANCLAALRSRDGRAVTARLDCRAMREADGRPLRVHMSLTDFTEHRRLEEEVAISERRLRLAVEQYPAAFVIFDRKGVVEFVNSQGAELFGRQPAELVGKRIEELSPPIPEAYAGLLNRTIQTAVPQRTDSRLELPGGPRDYVVTFAPLFDDGNDIIQIVGVLYDVSAQKRVQEDLEQAVLERTSDLRLANVAMKEEILERESITRQLIVNQRKLRSLSSELITTGERERQRLAAAVHDHIGQALAFTKINLGLLRQSLRDDDMVRQIDHLLSILDQTIRDTQTLIFELSPPVLSLLGLVPALEWLAEKMQEEYGLLIAVTDDGKPKPLAEDLRILLFQAVKELLTNVVKHARSKTARIDIWRGNSRIRILVEDDGIGMLPTEVESVKGFGLFSIRERLNHLDGTMEIDSKPGATHVLLEAPLSRVRGAGSKDRSGR